MASYSATLTNMTVVELKDILKQHQLKVSGKKAELIQRILDNNIHIQTNEPTTTQIIKPIAKKIKGSPQSKKTKFTTQQDIDHDHDRNVLIERISSSSISDKSIQMLIGLVKYGAKTLYINPDDDIVFFELASLVLAQNTKVNNIIINTSNIEGVNLIIDTIMMHPSCTTLNLTLGAADQNMVSNCGRLLLLNKTLKTFSIIATAPDNIILSVDHPYRELAYGLEHNNTLEDFTLKLLQIIDGRPFAKAIKNNRTLRMISLYHNFDDDTWDALGDAFKENTSVYKLKLLHFDAPILGYYLKPKNANFQKYDCAKTIPFLKQLAYNGSLRILDIDAIASANRLTMSTDKYYTCAPSSISDIERAFENNGSIVKLVGNNNKIIEKILHRNKINYLRMSKTLVYNILDDIDSSVINSDILDIEIQTFIKPYDQKYYYDILNNKTKKATIHWTSNESINTIAKILQLNSSLTELKIDQIDIDTQCSLSYRIFESILNSKFFNKLTKLVVFDNVDELSFNILRTIITTTTSIKILHFHSHYELTNIASIYDSMVQNYSITELGVSLFDVPENDDIGINISNMLRKNNVLTNLDIKINELDDIAGESIFNALVDNNTLLKLNISENYLQEKSIIACAHMIRHNQTLTSLDISNNRMGDERLLDIGKAMQENNTIKVLKMACVDGDNSNVLEYIPQKYKYLFKDKIFKLK